MNTTDLILAQFPGRVFIPMVKAGEAIGYKEQTSYNLHHKGKFPLRVRMQGRKPMVALTDLIAYVAGNETTMPAGASQSAKRGRKRNSELYEGPNFSGS